MVKLMTMESIKHTLLKSIWLLLVAGTILQGQIVPRPEQGTVEPSGKFTPANPQPIQIPDLYRNRKEAESALMKALKVSQVDEHAFKIGTVTFDKSKRTVTIPATVNMRTGLVEYALVGMPGKRHEALFTTETKPEHIHLACLFLGIGQEATDAKPNAPFQAHTKNRVRLAVTWEKHGPPAHYPLEALFSEEESPKQDTQSSKPLDWWYNGSILVPRGFVAQQEYSIIALISDLGALINDTRTVGKSNDRFYPNTRLLPKEGTAAKLILTFN